MSRAERLLEILELLRRRRAPVAGAVLAAELGISPRSLYRDIATLQAQGARIEGAAGLGYVLRPGFTLPPLMFRTDEIEALVLGARWVADRTDADLAAAARNALARISAVLPPALRDDLDASALFIGPGAGDSAGRDAGAPGSGAQGAGAQGAGAQGAGAQSAGMDFTPIRRAIRSESKIILAYRDGKGQATRRTIWPMALAFFDTTRVVVAWCELRQGFRNFRTDRISSLEVTRVRYARRRHELLEEWRILEGIPPL